MQGALGKVVSIDAHFNAPASKYPDRPAMSADELRLRNWLWDRELSGGILVEQNIHVIDICNWILAGHPTKAFATGGRNVLTHFGNILDNYQVGTSPTPDIMCTSVPPPLNSETSTGLTSQSASLASLGLSESPYSGPVRIVGKNALAVVRRRAAEDRR